MSREQLDDIETAHTMYRRGDYRAAASRYEGLAVRGFVEAQLILAGMYQEGRGVDKDLDVARTWYSRAAESGSPDGAYHLGLLLRSQGRYQEALASFEKAAAHGSAAALYRLGRMFLLGQGVRADRQQAYDYLEKAAKLGHPFARRDVALRLIKGEFGLRRIPEGIRAYFHALCAAADTLIASRRAPDNE